ncbi:hypothetical protein KR084_012246, partial [Drosophila pseudotakahashii]
MDGRIVGGTATTISSFPWQISLQRSGSHSCGGSIYSSNIIVTAAHCLQSVSASSLQVRAGSSYWSSGGVVSAVSAFRNHEGYNANTMVNDIAIIKLSSSLGLSSTIKTIGLASSNPSNGASASVSGWGTQSSGSSSIPSQLQYVNVNIVSQSVCASSAYSYGSQIRSTMICAAASGKDACQGDSGGPLVSGGQLVGVVSWGYGCAYSNYPGVYASVADLRTWVRVGSTYWRSGGSLHSVRAFRNHEGYNARTMVNDIAIIRIESDLSFRSSIREIRIADSNPREGATAVVSGWGTTESGGSTIPDHLLAVDLKIVDVSRCRSEEFGYGKKIKDTMICAYAAHKDACQGDSGGPLVSGDRLVGVVSWGYGCGEVRYPGVFADVAHFHEWIEETARD